MREILEILLKQFTEINLSLYTELDKEIVEPYEKVLEMFEANEKYLKETPNINERYRTKLEYNNLWLGKLLDNQASLINLHLRTGATRQVIIERDFYKEEYIKCKEENIKLIKNNYLKDDVMALLINKLPDPIKKDKNDLPNKSSNELKA